MAPLIAEMLDYDSTDIYVEPFGGGCRVLLNKPRHTVECYNDYGEGICAVMRVMSQPDSAKEFIERLGETEYSKEEFTRAKDLYDACENDPEEVARRDILMLIKENGGLQRNVLKALFPTDSGAMTKQQAKKFGVKLMESRPALEAWLKENQTVAPKFEALFQKWHDLVRIKHKQGYLPRPRHLYGKDISDMDLAVATYITFTQSRDAMGETWSAYRFKNTETYHNHMVGLYECAERMEGVQVYQIDAMNYFRWGEDDGQLTEWINNPRVMMYLDPSYIKPEDEQKLLKGIDVDNVSNLSEAISNSPKNLGKLYATSFSYADHESFLRRICDAKCKLLVSNYDLVLYDKYLTPERGWSRKEYHTTTSAGGKKENKRVEVLWYNY